MSIPSQEKRDLALVEITRVLKVGGIFIFTTHDRNEGRGIFGFLARRKGKSGNLVSKIPVSIILAI